MEANSSEHLRKNITGVCLIAGPLALLVGQIVHPVEKSDAADQLRLVAANLDRWYAAHLILLVAVVLMIPAVLGLAHLIHERRTMLAYVGGGLSLIGIVAVSALIGTDGVAGYFVASGTPDAPASVAFFDSVINSGRMMPLYIATLLFGLGLIVTAVGLYQTRVVAQWSAIAIGLGGLLVDIGFPAGAAAIVLVGMAVLLIGMLPVGYGVLTETDTEWVHTPEFRGFRHPTPGTA